MKLKTAIIIAGIISAVFTECPTGCNYDESGNHIGCLDGYGFRSGGDETQPSDCVPCVANCLSCPSSDTQCQTCQVNFNLSADLGECVCPAEIGFEVEDGQCLCKKCIYDDGECKDCPGEFVPSTDPEDFHENAALTMFVNEVYSDQVNFVLYRISFSEESIVLLSPLSPDSV